MISDRSVLAFLCCIIGVIICLGWSVLFQRYFLFWIPSLIALAFSIMGIVYVKKSEVFGFSLWFVAGIVALIFSIGALISIGADLLVNRYTLFWFPSLIAVVLIILGILVVKSNRIFGLVLCVLGGIIPLILGSIYGGIFWYTSFNIFFLFNFWGPIFIIAGGAIGYQDLKLRSTKGKSNHIVQKEE